MFVNILESLLRLAPEAAPVPFTVKLDGREALIWKGLIICDVISRF